MKTCAACHQEITTSERCHNSDCPLRNGYIFTNCDCPGPFCTENCDSVLVLVDLEIVGKFILPNE